MAESETSTVTKAEFEAAIGHEVDIEDYKIIEEVYTWHPTIDSYCAKGMEQVATIYKWPGGIRILKDMLPTARHYRDCLKVGRKALAEMRRSKTIMDEARSEVARLRQQGRVKSNE